MDLPSLCREYVNGQTSSDAPVTLAHGIQNGVIDLLKLVEALGIYLTSSNVDNRCSGIKLLSKVLIQLNLISHKLPIEDVKYLIAFYCDRLKDRAIMLPHVLAGMHAMVSQYQLSDQHVVSVCRAIFKEIHNQSLPFVDRSLVYSIMEHFLVNHVTAVQAIGSEFVLGYIQAIDGERDPRNLLTVFSSIPYIIQKLPFETLAEDLFEVTSCYFPIDFTPPPNDPNAVPREALITALRNCLTATPRFAEFCIPLLLKKLSSDLLSAKLDSLLTLERGAPVFGATNLQPFLDLLWAAIRKEMFMSSSAEVQLTSAKALASLSSSLSAPLHVSGYREDDLKSLIDRVLQDCQRYLREPGSKLIRPAVHVLCAVGRGSDAACSYVVTMVLPLLLEQYALLSQEGLRRIVLDALRSFVDVVKDTCSKEGLSPLSEFKEQLLDCLLLSSQVQTPTVIITIAIIKDLIEMQGLLESSQLMACCDYLKGLAMSSQEDSLRGASCNCLSVMAKNYPVLTKDHLLSQLLQTLSDPPPPPHTLSTLTSLSSHPELLSTTLPSLTQFLSITLSHPNPLWDQAQATADSLLVLVRDHGHSVACRDLLKGEEGLLVKLVCLCVRMRAESKGFDGVLTSARQLLWSYSKTATKEASEWLLSFLVRILVLGETMNFTGDIVLPRLDYKQPTEHTQLICLITALVSAAAKQVAVCYADTLVPVLMELACHSPHTNTSEQAAKAYAAIINKMEEGVSLTSTLDNHIPVIKKLISDLNMQQLKALNLWVWLTKALVTRSNKDGTKMALKLLDWCGHSNNCVKKEAAQGFKLLLEDTPDLLNTQCHANIRLFYKQQLFIRVVPQIVQQFNTTEPDNRQYLLQSLSHFMQGVPKQVLLSELPKLLPLLLQSLSSSEVGLKVSTLHGIRSLVQDTPSSIVEHVPTLIPRLLTFAQDKSSMEIRQAALKCIGVMTVLPTHSVYPYQGNVVRGLAKCLDDHKRLVRQDAVSARSKWFLLGT